MIYSPYCLRISKESRQILDICRREYGAEAGLNRFIEAIGKFCMSGDPEIDGISIRSFFDDALAGRLQNPDTIKSKLREAEENEYAIFSDWLKGDVGSAMLVKMCEKQTAAEYFAEAPNWVGILQEMFLDSENGLPLRLSTVKKYMSRWYQERIADGTAAEYLKSNIEDRMARRAGNG